LIAEQEQVITTSTAFPCYGGFPLGNGKMVGCHSHASPLALEAAIAYSCNAYFCKAFKNIIDNKKYRSTREAFNVWRKYILSFGLGIKLRCDVPNESAGYIPTDNYYDRAFGKNRWRSLSIISISIGQGEIQLTPLQLANVACIIANKGWFYTPHVVKAIGNLQNLNARYTKKNQTLVNPMYFGPVIDGMANVVEAGTAHNVKMDSITVCGKTGTAQNSGKNHSIFMAFAPKENAKIAIAVIVENSGYGATWAAPVASLLIERYLTGKVKRLDLEQEILTGKTTNLKPE
jgi:penicillin-binding protein 2